MTDTIAIGRGAGLADELRQLKSNWGWFLALGIHMLFNGWTLVMLSLALKNAGEEPVSAAQ